MTQLKYFTSFHSELWQTNSTRADLVPKDVCPTPRGQWCLWLGLSSSQ